VASSNYVLNEILDAPYDRLHPARRHRPPPRPSQSPLGMVQWIALFALGLAAGTAVSLPFLACLAALWIMGLVYNVPPVRAKDIPFVDVLAEAANNPSASWPAGTWCPPRRSPSRRS